MVEQINSLDVYKTNGAAPLIFDHENREHSLLVENLEPDPRTIDGLRYFTETIKDPRFPCIGAKQTVGRPGKFVMNTYGNMTSKETAEAMACDILAFLKFAKPEEIGKSAGLKPTSFAGYFPTTQFEDEMAACRGILTLVKNLNDLDSQHFPVPSEPVQFSRNVEDTNFAVCVGGHPFFTAFFHPHKEISSPRKTSGPVFVNFNSHHGFYYLKSKGDTHERWLDIIRGNIKSNYGEPHPDLVHHGLWSEVMQYLTVSLEHRDQALALIREIFGLREDSELLQTLSNMQSIVRERAVNAGCPYHM